MATQQTNPHRPGTKAAEKWDERNARRLEREKRAAVLSEELKASSEATSRVPAGFGDWGATRTKAWLIVSKQLRGMVNLKNHAPRHCEAMSTLRAQLMRIPGASLEDCAAIINDQAK